MPRMPAASRGARSLCMENLRFAMVDDSSCWSNTFLYGLAKSNRAVNPEITRGALPPLVAQRLAGFERVGDAFLSLLLAAKRDEGFALQIQNVLFADQLRRRQRTACKNVGELPRHMRVVIGSVAAAHHQVDGHLCGGEERFAQHFDLRGLRAFLPRGSGRLPPAAGKRQCDLLGVRNQAIA